MTVLLIAGAWVASSILVGFLLGIFFRFNEGYNAGLRNPAATPEIPPARSGGRK